MNLLEAISRAKALSHANIAAIIYNSSHGAYIKDQVIKLPFYQQKKTALKVRNGTGEE